VLDKIIANPADIELRLVWADELVAAGDPRGELIQVQCALASWKGGDRRRLLLREAELLAEHGARWQPPTIKEYHLGEREFRRGFVEHGKTQFPEAFDEIFDGTPLRSLHLSGSSFAQSKPKPLPWSPRFAQLEALQYEGYFADGLGALLARLDGLRTLTLEATRMDVPAEPCGVERLVLQRPNDHIFAAPAFTKLHALDLDFVYPDEKMIDDLLPRAASLEELRIRSGKSIDPPSWARLAPLLGGLVALDLSGNAIGWAGVRLLPAAMPRLRRLEIYQGQLGVDGVSALPELPALEELNLDNNGLGDSVVPILIARFPELRRLDLARATLSAQGIRALVAGMRRLEHLRIAMSSLDDGAARAIAEADSLGRLITLELNGNDFTSDGIVALARSPNVAGLEKLILRRNYGVDQVGIDALAASPHLELLCHLQVHVPLVDAKFKTAPLEARFGRRLVVQT
jgi:uncharacterized protein (TIGR02996 family)